MLRCVLAVFAGALVAVCVVALLEGVGHVVWPPPEGVFSKDPAQARAAFRQVPVGAFASVLVAWAVGTFLGAYLAARLAPWRQITCGLGVGALMMSGGVFTMLGIPHPQWFVIIGSLLFLPAAYAGARLGEH